MVGEHDLVYNRKVLFLVVFQLNAAALKAKVKQVILFKRGLLLGTSSLGVENAYKDLFLKFVLDELYEFSPIDSNIRVDEKEEY